MNTSVAASVMLVAGSVAATAVPAQGAGMNMLYLTKSVDFQHGPVIQKDGKPSVSEQVLAALAQQMGASLDCTKDGGVISAERLKNYKLVFFYTQGDLTKAGGQDNGGAMGANGVAELIEWIKGGGGFIGFHSATDTFDTEAPEASPYIRMIGAEFATHGSQFTGTIKVVDPTHPTMAHFPQDWALHEEWYLFRKFSKDTMHVMALMDPGEERAKQQNYNIAPYPVVWCSTLGKGRVYYTALGHREEIWQDPVFQKTVVDAIRWALGNGDAATAPNYEAVIAEAAKAPGAPGK